MNLDSLPKDAPPLTISEVAEILDLKPLELLYSLRDRNIAKMLLENVICEECGVWDDGEGAGYLVEDRYLLKRWYVDIKSEDIESVRNGMLSFEVYTTKIENGSGDRFYCLEKKPDGKICQSNITLDNVYITVEDARLLRDELIKDDVRHNEIKQTSPIDPEAEILLSEPNYFIFSGDGWKVRFNGGKHGYLHNSQRIKTLVEYLQSPNKPLNKAEMYIRLCSSGAVPEQVDESESLDSNNGDSNKIHSDNQSDLPTILLPIKKLSDQDKEKYIDSFKLLLDQYQKYEAIKSLEGKDNAETKITKFCDILNKEYGASCDREKGKIIWLKNTTERDESTRAAENISRHIGRAIENIEKLEKLGQLTGLSDHLKKYLKRKSSIYNPPPDFPGWYIAT